MILDEKVSCRCGAWFQWHEHANEEHRMHHQLAEQRCPDTLASSCDGEFWWQARIISRIYAGGKYFLGPLTSYQLEIFSESRSARAKLSATAYSCPKGVRLSFPSVLHSLLPSEVSKLICCYPSRFACFVSSSLLRKAWQRWEIT